jgi:restriction endonuclease S subunit
MRSMSDDAKLARLLEVAHVRAGHPFRGTVDAIEGGSVAVVQMKDILPTGRIDWRSTVRTELVGRKSPDWLQPGDLLFISRGSRYYAGYVDQAPCRAVCGAHLFHITVKQQEVLLPAFLAWQIGQPLAQKQLLQAASGSHQLSVAKPALEGLEIAIPPMNIQHLLVDLVHAAARERELLTKLIRNREQELEALADALVKGVKSSRSQTKP